MMPVISEVARSVEWLLKNDPKGWVKGTHSVAHPATGTGVWTSNGLFFCNPFTGVPRSDAERMGHILGGSEVKVSLLES